MLEHHIYTANRYMKQRFGNRVVRLSFDIGSPCPWGKCTFCDHSSFLPPGSIVPFSDGWLEQFARSTKFMSDRYKTHDFIAYFQSGTSTAGNVKHLKKLYKAAVSLRGIRGLTLSTRPDYISQEIIEAILDVAPDDFDIWLELGLQSTDESTLKKIKRGHTTQTYFDAVKTIEKYGNGRIKVLAHLILGLPGETKETMLKSVADSYSPAIVHGIKLHHLQLYHNTDMLAEYEKEPFHLFSEDEYIKFLAEVIAKTPKDIVIMRLFSTAKSDVLAAPLWHSVKPLLLNKLESYLSEHTIIQGMEV
ncbi:TIGR01212 family radical SAM protein [bacterium]|nr:TIGR01212 family radical SAM protein [bacterium]